MVNNVFGRAELGRDTACCKYLGRTRTLEECTASADKRGGMGSVTWHRLPAGGREPRPHEWAGTCFGIIDGTWQPVAVEQGQAEADSARSKGGKPLGPAPEMETEWMTER